MIRVQPKKWENNRCQLCTRQGINIQDILKKTAKIKHHKRSCISKWASKLIRQFSKEEIQIPNKYFEKCSIPFEIPSHSSWNPIIKKTNAGKDLGIIIKLYSHHGNQYRGSPKQTEGCMLNHCYTIQAQRVISFCQCITSLIALEP